MVGSKKQIKWAEDIKAGAFAAVKSMKETRRNYDELDGKRNSNLYDITWEAIEAVEAELLLMFNDPGMNDLPASALIDKRDMFTEGAIRKHARDWMRK